MAVTTSNTNKPILPRGADVRPIDSYNRASIYSGKALDFDGVNDYVNLDGFAMSGSTASFSFYVNPDGTGNVYFLDANPNRFVLRFSNNNVALFSGSLVEFDAIKTNEWTHLVYVLNGTSAKCYANGVQLGTEQTITAIDLSAATDFDLGRWYLGGAFYDGGMSNVRIFNTALTAAQVADLYNNPEKVVPTGVADSALKLWLPMMEGAGTTAINGAPDALGSELVTNGDFDTDSDWNYWGVIWEITDGKAKFKDASSGPLSQVGLTFDTSKNYVLTFDISDASGASIWIGNSGGSNSYTINANYQGYNNANYSLLLRGSDIGASETTLAFWGNSSGSAFSIDNISLKEVANCGTISGATWTHGIGAPVAQTSVIDWNKWKLEGGGTSNEYLIPQGLTSGRDLLGNLFENARKYGALNLDGNSWAEVHDNASLDIVDEVTLELWYYHKETPNIEQLIGKRKNGDVNWLRIYSASTDTVKLERNGGAASGNFAITENAWNHITATIDSSDNMKFYIGGAQVGSASSFAPWGLNTSGVLSIGAWVSSAVVVSNSIASGQIAQPRVYNRALTASEVLNNYNVTKNLYI